MKLRPENLYLNKEHGHFSYFNLKHGKLDNLPFDRDKLQNFKHSNEPWIKMVIFVKKKMVCKTRQTKYDINKSNDALKK